MRNLNLSEQGSDNQSPQEGLSNQTKSDIFTMMNQQYPGREFGEHDLTQVQQSLSAEGKDEHDPQTVIQDMQDYANKTGGAMEGMTEEGQMKMAA